jgi:uncharacterized protein
MAVLLEIKVTPQSGRQQFVRDKSGIIKCFLKSAPEGGKANEELMKLIGKLVGVSQEHIRLIQGATSRKKVLKIDTTLDQRAVLQRLGVEIQTSF